ncbi:MAG: serine hydrolase [Pseudomonadota bacterium]
MISTRKEAVRAIACVTVMALSLTDIALAQAPQGAEPIVFSRQIAHAKRSEHQALADQLSGTGFIPVSAQSPANNRYNVVWQKDFNVESYAIHTNLSRDAYEDKRDQYKRKGFRRSFVTGYSNDKKVRYNAIWVKEREARKRRVHSMLSKKDLLKKLRSYNRSGYTPVDILPWRHDKKVYYSAVWVRDKRDAAWLVDATRKEWDSFHKEKRGADYSLRDIGMLGASKSSGVRYSGVWVKDKATRRHYRHMNLTTAELSGVLADKIKDNYRVSDIDSAYVGDEVRFAVLMHRPARRNRLIANFEIPEEVEDTLLTMLEEYRLPGNNGHSGNVGFYLENYDSGRFIAYNPDEHYFMSSTRKVILGASALQNGFKTSNRRSVNLDIENYRYDTRDPGSSIGGIDYPSINKASLSSRFTPSQLLAAMLDASENTAADYFFEQWAGMREMRKTLEALGTKNFGEMISKCEQERRSLMVIPGFDDLRDIRCHVLREWIQDPQGRVRSANPDEREILDGKRIDRTRSRWRTHIDKHYNAITPRTYAAFFKALADEELLNRRRRGDLLSHMSRSNRLFGPDSLRGTLFDTHAAKNGATFRNRAWVVFTWNWRTSGRDFDKIDPRHSFVFLTEDHNEEDPSRADRADNLGAAIFQVALPSLEGS